MSLWPIIAGSIDTPGDIIAWILLGLIFISPIAVLVALPILLGAFQKNASSAQRIFKLLMGGISAAVGIFIGHELYWQSHNQIPALVWFCGGGLIGGILGTITGSVILRIYNALFQRRQSDANGVPKQPT